MPILTKDPIIKGIPASFTLDKSLLKTVPSDLYFQDDANWKTVVMKYKSTTGNQSKKVIFDATKASPVGTLHLSVKALSDFEVKEILIYDFDGGVHSIPRSALTASEFDISLGGATGSALLWDTINNPAALATSGNGELHRTDAGNQLGTNPIAYNSIKKVGDFTFSGVYKHGVGPGTRQSLVGLSKITPTAYGVQAAGYGIIFQDGNIAHIWDVASANVSLVDGQSYNFEIKRVGITVTYKIDSTVLGTYDVGAQDVYLVACMQVGLNQIVSTSIS